MHNRKSRDDVREGMRDGARASKQCYTTRKKPTTAAQALGKTYQYAHSIK